ncbi:hypothetical protein N802_00575 [Knoellia sinensis KCTC 19936]|uniref:DUF4386 domain-containing protein n=1 Tax=Knoellia sinensis KCTC 19936 TaxID=1385520 RepID=A0A0A0JCX5_9MICO|nr:hypothetical protein [Knoellia sinensis]KGN34988.1 hypothetical protein N802_00575 [Knoellia sinensis KCTC 19936]
MGVEERWQRLARWAGALGLLGIALLYAPIIAISTLGEPPLHASEAEIAEFYRNTSTTSWYEAAEITSVIGTLVLTWALVGVAMVLGRAEGAPFWRAAMAVLAAGILSANSVGNVGWAVVGRHGPELDIDVAHYAFDSGNIAFANLWLALASFAVACGWVTLETGVFPHWTGWLAMAAAVGFVVARFFWTSEVWLIPYAAFWVWMIALFVRLVRGRVPSPGPAPTATEEHALP